MELIHVRLLFVFMIIMYWIYFILLFGNSAIFVLFYCVFLFLFSPDTRKAWRIRIYRLVPVRYPPHLNVTTYLMLPQPISAVFQ